MAATKIGYKQVDNTTSIIKNTPAGFFGLTVITGGDVDVYDGLNASGIPLYSKAAMAKGESVNFGANGMAANTGLTVVTTGKVNVLYT